MVQVVEVKHDSQGKSYAQQVLNGSIQVPCYTPDIVNGRWYGIFTGRKTTLSGDRDKMVRAMLEAIVASEKITTQRNIYYTVRGAHPDWTYNGKELKDDKVYQALTGSLMEDVQLATFHTMQSLGVWAAPRGYVKGDGTITTRVRGQVPLQAMPALSFDLVDTDVFVQSNARKIIHFEKDAGFEGLAGQDNCIMLESMFSTSQGYLVEAANKFLGDCQQKRGMNVYVVHDADPHGCFTQTAFVTPVNGDTKQISKFQKGDELYTLDDSKNLVKTTIIDKSERWVSSEEILCIKINTPRINRKGERTVTIMCTKNHPFDVVTEDGDVNWVPAEKLVVGDIVVDAGNLVLNEKIRVQKPNMKGIQKYRDSNLSWAKSLSRSAMKKITPSKTELFLLGLFTYEKLPIEWVGGTLEVGATKGQVFQRGIYPDFQIIGTKKLIEVSCKSYLEYRQKISYEQYKTERKQIYEKYGYTVLFIDVDEDTPFEILKKVKSFISNGSRIIEINAINGRQLSRLIQGKQSKRDENGKLWVKVYNFECSPYNSYLVENLHVHNCQMQMMYGMSSKSSCYMPSSFYPLPNTAKLLGLFPRVAQELGLPAEDCSETSRKIIPNLRKLSDEHPEMIEEVDIIDNENKQWEFQALNGMGGSAPEIYLIESLRAKNDEIKHVPTEDNVKIQIINGIKNRRDNYIEFYLNRFLDDWFNRSGGLKDELKGKLREILKPQIDQFNEDSTRDIAQLENVEAEDFRETVKQHLVDNPKQYWSNVASHMVYSSSFSGGLPNFKFEITAEPQVTVTLGDTKVEVDGTIEMPEPPVEPLTKNDIVDSIETQMVPDESTRTELREKIRQALETILGEPELEW